MNKPVKTGHVYPAGAKVFQGPEDEGVYRARNALLVKALRSGTFTQAQGALEAIRYSGYRYEVTGNCCLGVACRVAEHEANGFSIVTQITGSGVNFGTLSYDDIGEEMFSSRAAGYPPKLVKEWFGWEETNPILWATDHHGLSAAHLNDNSGMPFDGIADAFERTFVTFTRRSVDDLTDEETTVSDLPE